jgi:hypothetical protein
MRRSSHIRSAALAMLFAATSAAHAQERAPDKSQFNLFNPTPRQLMRELSADRPDVTESPYTVDAGHVQLEMSFVEFAYDDEDDVETRALSIAPVNLKLGLLNNLDLQLVLEPYLRAELENGADATLDGFGDAQLRLKVNLWGNDGGESAFAVMPFAELPTASDDLDEHDHVEGGIILPYARELPGEFSLGLMAEFDFLYDEADDDYVTEFVHTASLGHDLARGFAGYVEYIGIEPLDGGGDYQALLGAGITYALNDDAQLDAGVTVALTDDAEDVTIFTGLTFRI